MYDIAYWADEFRANYLPNCEDEYEARDLISELVERALEDFVARLELRLEKEIDFWLDMIEQINAEEDEAEAVLAYLAPTEKDEP